jgi:mannonate dehydratase
MRISLVMPELSDANLRLARQMGVSDIVAGLPTARAGQPVTLEAILPLKQRIEAAGLRWSVVEGLQTTDRVKMGLPGADGDIAAYIASLRAVGEAGIPVVCYNWMAVFGWLRTSTDTPVRGGALATTYDHAQFQRGELSAYGQVSEDRVWSALETFMRAVVPVAEEAGVKLAIHPDDPPLSPVRGIGRVLISPDNMQRAIDLAPSPNNGITFCQGCFAEMGADLPREIARFGRADKMFFAHFRNLTGNAEHFTESFHDEGDVDMVAAMRAFHEVGFTYTMRPDHVPTMEGDDNARAGYTLLGRLFAVGYMRGLMQAIERGC